jgi:hypothetical protein
MSLLKRISRAAWTRRLAASTVAWYMRLVRHSGRWAVYGGHIPAGFWDRDEPFILATWHGRLLMMPLAWRRGVAMRMLVSRHRDGELISRTIAHFGVETVRGSSSRNGAGAVRAMVRALRAGISVGITPDAPRGPYMRASRGVVAIAQLSGAAIVPAVYGVARRRVLPTWDRFTVPAPFSRGVFMWGEPLRVAKDEDPVAARLELETRLNALSAEADRACGQEPVQPASLEATDRMTAPVHGAESAG